MTMINIKMCQDIVNRKRTMDKESLGGTLTVGDRAESVLCNAELIIKNKAVLSDSFASPRAIAKAKENIASCTDTIKRALDKLGVNENEKSEIVAWVEKGDMEQVRYNLLKVLAKRNPGLYSRKLAIAEKQMQH
ncbi:MAG: hypothetical protein IJ866_01360 [Alphaproteobacteria bacterium]|nr:hypothetical protein [Alphaproteobacteria bacterium]